MIRLLQLTNFQGHVDTTLELGPGVNVITGQGDSGKSSLIRALEWAIRNRPSGAGEAFRNWTAAKGAETRVVLETGEGDRVERFRKAQRNGYVVNGAELVAVRADVPEEASVPLDIGDFSIQSQHSPYFLLNDSPGEVARKLNEVCGLDLIDSCQSNAGLLASRNAQERREAEERAAQLEGRREAYADLEEREAAVASLEALESSLKETRERAEALGRYCEAIRSTHREIKELEPVANLQEELEELEETAGEAKRLRERAWALDSFLEEAERVDKALEGAREEARKAEEEFHEALAGAEVCPLCEQEIQ